MKTQKTNIIKDSINYLKIFVPLSIKAASFLHIGQAISNPLKVSYIKKEKVLGLLENIGFVLGKYPTRKDREKYFTATTIEKLLNELFNPTTEDHTQKIQQVSESIDKHLKQSIKTELFFEKDVSGFYSQEIKTYSYNRNGSCMAGKPRSYFKLYDLINEDEQQVQIVGLKSGGLVVARALLWRDNNTFYLDRIYIADFLQNSSIEQLQTELFLKVKRTYKLDNLNTFNKSHIIEHLKQTHKKRFDLLVEKNKTRDNKIKIYFCIKYAYPTFEIEVDQDNFNNIGHYPFADTFKYVIDTGSSLNFNISSDDDETKYILDCTAGEITNKEKSLECMDCGGSYDEEEDGIYYSELEDNYLCDDCSCYIEERGESCSRDNATYNNYSGDYHYTNDLHN
tara:strand:+ start:653 stop:1837 length:1185 start_codon:yes stop_codon:yes gene_type:complete